MCLQEAAGNFDKMSEKKLKKNLRFYFALWFAKGTALVLKLIGRKGTSMPGSWAIILCPDFIGRMDKPEKIIAITGTNGKTTISNMVDDILERRGEDFVCNREGSNVPTGIASALIANSNFFGKPKKKLAVFEVDERSSLRIYPYMQPDILAVTNIFRDSYKRNAHTEYITNILNGCIPDKTKLILNGDDPLCSSLKKNNDRAYFGIDKLSFESGHTKNIVRDGAVCPECHTPLTYDFTRYHHVGKAHCENCGYHTPEADYRVTSVDKEKGRIYANIKGEDIDIKMLDDSPINIYNQITAAAVLYEHGLSLEEIKNAFEEQKIDTTRFEKTVHEGKTYIRHLCKGQNPVASSRCMENAKNIPGKKIVYAFLDDHFDETSSVENPAWFFDVDFEFLNDDSIGQIIVGGARHWDVYLRLLMAGIPAEKIVHSREKMPAVEKSDVKNHDTFVIFYDVYTIGLSNQIQNKVMDMCSQLEKEEK